MIYLLILYTHIFLLIIYHYKIDIFLFFREYIKDIFIYGFTMKICARIYIFYCFISHIFLEKLKMILK